MSNSSSIIIDQNLNWGTVCDRSFHILYDSGGPITLLQYSQYVCTLLEHVQRYKRDLVGIPRALDVMFIKRRCARPEVRTSACERMMSHPVSCCNFPIIRCILSSMCAHDNNQLVFSQCVGKLPLDKLDDRIQWLVCTEDTGLARIKDFSPLHR